MATGAVSFKNHKFVKFINIEKNKDIIRQVTKTKTEVNPDFAKDYREYCDEIQR